MDNNLFFNVEANNKVLSMPPISYDDHVSLPEVYVSLDRFAEVFHQKLDAAHEDLQGIVIR